MAEVTGVKEESFLIFVGTGSSTGTPRIGCLLNREKHCNVCEDSLIKGSKNRRRNPSVLIQYKNKNILIDCGNITGFICLRLQGKTFREAMIDVIDAYKITTLDAVVITHGHSDAFLGLDDLREFTEKLTVPVYIRKSDVPIISNCFPYLFDTRKATGSGYVSKINFVEFDEEAPFDVLGLQFTPLIVDHGPRNTALGFRIQDILYLSDLSGIPDTTRPLLEPGPDGIQLLIIDSLRIKEKVNSHFSLEEAVEEIRKIKPKMTYLTGMSHEFHYEKSNKHLEKYQEEGLTIRVPHDCMRIPIQLQ